MSPAEDHGILNEPIAGQLLDLGEEVVAELIELYEQQLVALMPEVRSSDPALARRAAHTLKGSSANLGLKQVARLAAAIEAGTAGVGTVEEIEPAAAAGLDALRSRTT